MSFDMRSGKAIALTVWIVLGASCPPLVAAGQSVRDEAWSVLDAGLHNKSADKRAEAIAALGLAVGDQKALKTAEEALEDPNPNIRIAAVTALGNMNEKAALPEIKALLREGDAKTTLAIAAVLKKFGDAEGYEIYYELLMGERKDGEKLVDGIKDKKGLEKMGAKTAIGFLPFGGVATGTYDYLEQNGKSHASVYVTAVNALAEDRDPKAEKALVRAVFGGKEPVQLAALQGLAKRGDAKVVNDIEPAMHSEKDLVSYTAAAATLHLLAVGQKPVGGPEKAVPR
jgi:HEAT repeat protein